MKWISLNNEYIRGQAFNEGFCRLPKDAYVNENVNNLKFHPAGLNISFVTNSKQISLKAKLAGGVYMSHMTGTGQVGFDIYFKHDGKFIYGASTKTSMAEYEALLLSNLDGNNREYRIYFPLYQKLLEAYVGIDDDAALEFTKQKQERLVIYGTSITQGGCASRPGMAYPSILDRNIDLEVINLGFSGSAHMEDEIITYLNSIDCKYLLITTEANNTYEHMEERLATFLSKLNHKDIYLMSRFPNQLTLLDDNIKNTYLKNQKLQKNMPNVTYIDGWKMLENLDYDFSVDGVHLTDLGFYYVAKELEKYFK